MAKLGIRILICLVLFQFAALAIYLLFSLVFWSFNPYCWGDARVGCAFLLFILWGISIFIACDIDDKWIKSTFNIE